MIVILPSRDRPKRLAETLESIAAMKTKHAIIVRIDEDDRHLRSYLKLRLPRHVSMTVGPRVGIGGSMNEAFRRFPREDCYGFLADDVMIRTTGWDEKLRLAAGNAKVAYPNDLLKGEKLSTHPFVGGDLVRTLGWFSLPRLTCLYMDAVWMSIGKKYKNLAYCPEVIVEHMHWSVNKADKDATYAKPEKEADRAIFRKWKDGFYESAPDPRIVKLFESRA